MGKNEITVSELLPDARNANIGTARGRGMLEKSLQKYGAGRSILIDKNNRIIAGNKTIECAGSIGLEDVQVVESDGKRIIAVKRTDLDLQTDKTARELAFADNRIAQVDLEWSADEITAAKEDGCEIDWMFEDFDVDLEPQGEEDDSVKVVERFVVEIDCGNEEKQEKTYNKLMSEGYECRILKL